MTRDHLRMSNDGNGDCCIEDREQSPCRFPPVPAYTAEQAAEIDASWERMARRHGYASFEAMWNEHMGI